MDTLLKKHVCEKAIFYFDSYATESIKSYGNWKCLDNDVMALFLLVILLLDIVFASFFDARCWVLNVLRLSVVVLMGLI